MNITISIQSAAAKEIVDLVQRIQGRQELIEFNLDGRELGRVVQQAIGDNDEATKL